MPQPNHITRLTHHHTFTSIIQKHNDRDLNPESGDTGGVLKGDWWTPEEEKLKVYDRVQPHPSWLSKVRRSFVDVGLLV